MKKLLILTLILITSFNLFSQNCEPTMKSKDGTMEYYGGAIRNGLGIMTDDKSNYSFYIFQVNKGKNGTYAIVSFYESVASTNDYNKAINDYLNESKLKTSFLEISLNNNLVRIPSSSCTLTPEKSLGSVYGYSVTFVGNITKEQIILLQKYYINKFKIVLGGKPYEKVFNKPTKKTEAIKNAINCINTENMFEVKKKKSSELNLDKVELSNYSKEITGKWLLQGGNGITLEFIDDKLIVKQYNKILSEGTYKIVGTRLIYMSTNNNDVSNFELFLKDMIILKEKGKELTYERIE